LGRFLTLPERASKKTSNKHGKKCENQGFWSPKTLPKPPPKTLPNRYPKKHMIFESIFDNILQTSKPRNLENINFASTGTRFFRISQNCVFALWRRFGFENPPQNPSEIRAEPFKNRCQKCVVF